MPRNSGANSYLRRMNFFEFVHNHCATVRNPPPPVHRRDRSQLLLELTWFDASETLDVVADLLFDRLDGLVPTSTIGELWMSLCEIGDNARYHSGAGTSTTGSAEPTRNWPNARPAP